MLCSLLNQSRKHHTCHLTISQLEIPSRMTRRCWSIFQSAYISRVAMTARRWSGPTLPFFASSCDLQMQVARLRKSWLGLPNQYLSSDRVRRARARQVWSCAGKPATGLLQEPSARHGLCMRRLVQRSEIRVVGRGLVLRSECNDVPGRLLESDPPCRRQLSDSVYHLLPVEGVGIGSGGIVVSQWPHLGESLG